jgi:hypothetical protein
MSTTPQTHSIQELKRLGAAARLVEVESDPDRPGYQLALPAVSSPVVVDWVARRCNQSACRQCAHFPTFTTLLERRIQEAACAYVGYVAYLHQAQQGDEARRLADYQPQAADFQTEPLHSSAEKARTVRAYIQFAASGFEARHFTRAVYLELYLHCGFIAHYDRHGFYAEYFARLPDQRRFALAVSGEGEYFGIGGWNPYDTARTIKDWTLQAAQARLFFQTPAELRPPNPPHISKQQLGLDFSFA